NISSDMEERNVGSFSSTVSSQSRSSRYDSAKYTYDFDSFVSDAVTIYQIKSELDSYLEEMVFSFSLSL
ncbi:hypothetical protein PJI17_32195, partial [Mycobacterium kansasii]